MNDKEILNKYSKKIGELIDTTDTSTLFSQEYTIFRRESLSKQVTRYEDWCNTAVNILKVTVKPAEEALLQENIVLAHLDITPTGAASFAALVGIFTTLLGIIYLGLGFILFGTLPIFIPLLLILLGLFSIKPLTRLPVYIANKWRLKASNQMVLCILYIVMYMRHTSNLEHAIKFAGEHIGTPLNLDLRKIFWDIETEKYTTITESLDHYLETWKKYNLEFVESFHLIQGSLFENVESRRLDLLDKALDVMLEGTYDNMLHFAHNLKNPITMLHMLGVILPILGLVMFPLIGSFLSGAIRWYHLAIIYNILLPAFVIFLGKQILDKRPTGYGSAENETALPVPPTSKAIAWTIFLAFTIIGCAPIIINLIDPTFDFPFLQGKFLDYQHGQGPYGTGSMLLSLFLPLGAAIALSVYYHLKTKNLIEQREQQQKLEQEFSGALFLLGNKVADGIPVELAFPKIAATMETTATGDFFNIVARNIQKLGMSVNEAIFNPSEGAIKNYPSPLIQSSMKVLVEGARKGSQIVAKSMITISQYVEKIRKVNERLTDLLSDIIGSMRSQITFLTPVIAGIVIGVSSMVVTIINKLGEQFANLEQGSDLGGLASIANIINIKDVIPGFQFQIVVGLYVVEITLILIYLANQIERGIDPVYTQNDIGKTLARSTALYVVISGIGIILFNFLAAAVSTVTNATG
ncbi:MAG: hypothetical protein Q7R96_02170 [Nanoarchaeota archaeon]|nr:hypothetical protein [Nanoarchaeota archaeon]